MQAETDVKWSILRACIFLSQFLRISSVSNNNVFAIHNWKGLPAHSSLKLKSKLNVIIHPEESIPSWICQTHERTLEGETNGCDIESTRYAIKISLLIMEVLVFHQDIYVIKLNIIWREPNLYR